jgi:hypothetical protein
VHRIVVLCSWLRCPELILFSATIRFSGCSSRIYRSCRWNVLSVQRGPDRIRMCTIYSQCCQSQVVLNCPKETRDFPRPETIPLDVVPEQKLKWCHSSPRCLLWRQWVLWVDIYRKVVFCVLVWFQVIPVLRRREVALILSRLLQPRVALPRDHAAIAFLDVGVGFAGRADSCCVSRHFSGSLKFMYQHP